MQKISIKREQSQAGLSFAERENRRSAAGGKAKFRPQVKNKLLLLLALLMTAATGAWAQEPATTYSVKMKDGTQDAKNWTIASGQNSATGDAADGLTGLSEGDQVTIQYSGRLKVKGVTAVSDAAAAAVPDGAISGVFSVSDSKQVYFSKGNLRYASSKWSFFDNQYDYYTSYSADAWDKFGWSTAATTYGMNTSTSNSSYSGDFVDWGATMGTGWRTLSKDEWTYLFNTRSASAVNGTDNGRYAKAKVNDVQGVILFPDTYTHPDGLAAPTGVNATDATGWEGNSYTAEDWAKMESAGCVFLPAAGNRYGSTVNVPGMGGYYWSATPNGADYAYYVYFGAGSLNPANYSNRRFGCSVRLVQEVATAQAVPAGGHALSASVVGEIVGSDGKAYAAADKGNLPTGVTAVAMVAYKSATAGSSLAIALADEGSMNWATAKSTCEGKTAIGGNSWKLPSQDEWKQMFGANGGNNGSYTGLNTAITTAGGTALQEDGDYYWSSTPSGGVAARRVRLLDGGAYWGSGSVDNDNRVRACLAF